MNAFKNDVVNMMVDRADDESDAANILNKQYNFRYE